MVADQEPIISDVVHAAGYNNNTGTEVVRLSADRLSADQLSADLLYFLRTYNYNHIV